MRNKAAILMLIEGYQDIDTAEGKIEERVMKKFNLSREKVKDYMVGKSA